MRFISIWMKPPPPRARRFRPASFSITMPVAKWSGLKCFISPNGSRLKSWAGCRWKRSGHDGRQSESLVRRGSRFLSAKQRDAGADVSALEREIDQQLYALYGLTPEEIKIVEEATDSDSSRQIAANKIQ